MRNDLGIRPRIGFFVDALDRNFQCQVLEGISDACHEKGIDLIIYSGALQFEQNERNIQYELVKDFIFPNEIDGLLVLGGAITEHYAVSDFLEVLKSFQPLPIVTIAFDSPEIPSITVDNCSGIREIVRHFVHTHGYRRIAFFKGPACHQEALLRYHAYSLALAEEGLVFDADLVVEGHYFNEAAGIEAVRILLDTRNTRVDAILAADDSIALGALGELRRRGIRVPDDIALAGFDDQEACRFSDPPLTTVFQPFYQQGVSAVSALMQLIGKPPTNPSVILQTQMVVRGSCGCKIGSVKAADNFTAQGENYKLMWENSRFRQINDEEDRYRLHIITHLMLTTFRYDDLIALIYAKFPSLGIQDCYIVLYESLEGCSIHSNCWVKPGQAELVVGFSEGRDRLNATKSIHFPTVELLPNGWLEHTTRRSFVFLPLSFKDEHFGYVIFDFNPLTIVNLYENLRVILGSALRSCFLVKRLERSVQEKTNFLINIAHEIKTPVTIISSYLEKYLGNPSNIDDLKIARQNVNKLRQDMLNILDSEKLNRGLVFYDHSTSIDLSLVLAAKVKDFSRLAENQGIAIDLHCTQELFIAMDVAALDRVMNNLLDNALRYNRQGGKIIICARREAARVSITVANTGNIIDNSNKHKIFDPFQQISREKRSIKGIGMGLNIVRRTLEDANGTIQVLPGAELTTFSIELPYTPPAEGQLPVCFYGNSPDEIVPLDIVVRAYQGGRNTLLLVDDNRQMIAFLNDTLGSEYNIFYAFTAKEALAILSREPEINLIISDIMMDGTDGYSFLKEVKVMPKTSGVPFLFLTAKEAEVDRSKGLSLGAVEYICKPFSLAELKARVYALLRFKDEVGKRMKDQLAADLLHYLQSPDPARGMVSEQVEHMDFDLTERELEIVACLKRGRLYKEIAEQLGITVNTVKVHVSHIYKKCGVGNKVELLNLR